LGGLIPLSDASRRPVRLPVVTAFIIVVNVFVFLLELTRGDAFVTGNPRVVEEMSNVGVGRYLRLLGVMEIAFAALFVVPATMKLGFILASCYFAGAIATELSHDVLKVNPFVPIAPLWIGAFIRDRSIFF
jgi:DoxX-like family